MQMSFGLILNYPTAVPFQCPVADRVQRLARCVSLSGRHPVAAEFLSFRPLKACGPGRHVQVRPKEALNVEGNTCVLSGGL